MRGCPACVACLMGRSPSPGRYHRLPLPEQGAPLEAQFDAFISILRVSGGKRGAGSMEGGQVLGEWVCVKAPSPWRCPGGCGFWRKAEGVSVWAVCVSGVGVYLYIL